jgi:hypothetical protein
MMAATATAVVVVVARSVGDVGKNQLSSTKGEPQVDVILMGRPQVDVILTGRPQVDVILTGVRPSDEQAPIKLVDGRPWSPGVYRALHLLGRSLETAWEKAFIRSSHF